MEHRHAREKIGEVILIRRWTQMFAQQAMRKKAAAGCSIPKKTSFREGVS